MVQNRSVKQDTRYVSNPKTWPAVVSAVPDIEQEHDVNMIQDLKKDILPVTILSGVKNAYLSMSKLCA